MDSVKNGYTAYQNLQDQANPLLRGNFQVLNAYTRKEEMA